MTEEKLDRFTWAVWEVEWEAVYRKAGLDIIKDFVRQANLTPEQKQAVAVACGVSGAVARNRIE